jgi:hypothetical protein
MNLIPTTHINQSYSSRLREKEILLITILFISYFCFLENPNLSNLLVRELSGTQTRLECLAISLVYVAISIILLAPLFTLVV